MQINGDIIVGIDGSQSCEEAAAWALKASRHHGTGLVLVSVVSPDHPKHASLPEAQQAAAASLDAVGARLRGLIPDAAFATRVEEGDPAEVLAALSERASLVVIGQHGSDGDAGGRIGTISSGLPGHALSAVLVHRVGRLSEFDSVDSHALTGGGVIVGHDTSDYAGLAALDGAAFAVRTGSPLRLIVATTNDDDERARHQTELDMAWLRSERPGLDVTAEFVDGPAAGVLAERSADADLLVVGKRGTGRFASMRVQLGRTAAQVLSDARSSLLLVPFRDDSTLSRRRVTD